MNETNDSNLSDHSRDIAETIERLKEMFDKTIESSTDVYRKLEPIVVHYDVQGWIDDTLGHYKIKLELKQDIFNNFNHFKRVLKETLEYLEQLRNGLEETENSYMNLKETYFSPKQDEVASEDFIHFHVCYLELVLWKERLEKEIDSYESRCHHYISCLESASSKYRPLEAVSLD